MVQAASCLAQAVEKEGRRGGQGVNHEDGRPQPRHTPGIQQEPSRKQAVEIAPFLPMRPNRRGTPVGEAPGVRPEDATRSLASDGSAPTNLPPALLRDDATAVDDAGARRIVMPFMEACHGHAPPPLAPRRQNRLLLIPLARIGFGLTEGMRRESKARVRNKTHRHRRGEKKTGHGHEQCPTECKDHRQESRQASLHRRAPPSQPRSAHQDRGTVVPTRRRVHTGYQSIKDTN
jgi:hypothetical protein